MTAGKVAAPFSCDELALISAALVSYENDAPKIHSWAVSKLADRVLSIQTGKVRIPRLRQPVAVAIQIHPNYFGPERRHSVRKGRK